MMIGRKLFPDRCGNGGNALNKFIHISIALILLMLFFMLPFSLHMFCVYNRYNTITHLFFQLIYKKYIISFTFDLCNQKELFMQKPNNPRSDFRIMPFQIVK